MMGPRFPQMAATFVRNLSEGRVRVAMGRCDAASARWGGPGSREPRQDQRLKRRLALGARLAENVACCPASGEGFGFPDGARGHSRGRARL